MTTDNSRADALNLLVEANDFGQFDDDFDQPLAKPIRKAIRDLLGDGLYVTDRQVLGRAAKLLDTCGISPAMDYAADNIRQLLATSAVEQHEAAPAKPDAFELSRRAVAKDMQGFNARMEAISKKRGAQPTPSAPLEGTGNGADERAALAEVRKQLELIKGGGAQHWPGGWSGTVFACDAALLELARASSPNAAGAEGAKPCETCGGRGEVGGWRAGEGYDAEACPDCAARAPRTEVAGTVPIAMETRDTKDARYFRWLCAHPDWHFIEALCQQFVAESQVEFYTKLSAEIEKRIKHGANKGKKRLPNGSLAFPESVVAAPHPPSADAAAAPRLTTDHAFALYMLARTTGDSERWIAELHRALGEILATQQPQPRDEVTDDEYCPNCNCQRDGHAPCVFAQDEAKRRAKLAPIDAARAGEGQ